MVFSDSLGDVVALFEEDSKPVSLLVSATWPAKTPACVRGISQEIGVRDTDAHDTDAPTRPAATPADA
jgi:hypothetical protein